MDKEKGRNELVYQATMGAAKKMLDQRLITEEQYRQFEAEMKDKYSPAIGVLFSDIDLL